MSNGNGSVQDRPDVLVRELPPDEFGMLADYSPFKESGILPDPERVKIVVAQRVDNGVLVAAAFVSFVAHMDPIWLDENSRGRAGLTRRFWKAIRQLLDKYGIPAVYSVIHDVDIPRGILSQAVHLGFNKIQGSLYLLSTDTVTDRERTVEIARN